MSVCVPVLFLSPKVYWLVQRFLVAWYSVALLTAELQLDISLRLSLLGGSHCIYHNDAQDTEVSKRGWIDYIRYQKYPPAVSNITSSQKS